MEKRFVLVFVVAFLLYVPWVVVAVEDTTEEVCPWAGDQEVALLLKTVRGTYDVPAVAGAIVTSEGMMTMATVGVRKRGSKTPVTLDDTWHLGSITKAMTATLVAKLVEQGILAWHTRIVDVFPELMDQFDPNLGEVTVLQLLSHRSGLPKDLDLDAYRGACVLQERLRAVTVELAKPPATEPGQEYVYSNLGYIIAGAMIEKLTHKSWEENMVDRVFTPLGMDDTGFGGVGTPGFIDQPWGHTEQGDPVEGNGPDVDNPPVLGPAGRVHCPLQDWACFVVDQLRGARGCSSLLKPSSYTTLQRPHFGGEYALGWIKTDRDWAGGLALHHTGSNTMNYANVWIAPKRDFAVLVCVNQGGDRAFKASDAAASALIDTHKILLSGK